MRNLLIIAAMLMVCWSSTRDLQVADIKWVDGYYTRSGQYRSGHYRDTSNDGYQYNNANYLGYND